MTTLPGAKTGMYTVATLIVHACRVYTRYAPVAQNAIVNSALVSSDKDLLIAAIVAMQAACAAAQQLKKLL